MEAVEQEEIPSINPESSSENARSSYLFPIKRVMLSGFIYPKTEAEEVEMTAISGPTSTQ